MAALFAILWIEHKLPLELPSPTGPYAVGRTTQVWSDGAAVPHELFAWIWYPAPPRQPSQTVED